VWENNNLGQKNITIVDVHRGQFIEFPYRFSHINARDPFVTLDIQKLKAPRGLQIFLDVKRPQMLEAIAKAAGVAISTVPLTPVLPVTPEMPVVPVAPIASLHSDVPWRLTFLEETRIAMSSGGDRAENDGFVVTFPSGSSVDVGIGRAEVTAPENRIETLALSGESEDKEATRASTAARPMFSVAALEGRKVLAFNPALKLAKVKVPLARPGFQESSLKIRVPENAVPGDNYIFDVAERNSKGRLVGGVRLQVHVVE
jgi:hypothetical protein